MGVASRCLHNLINVGRLRIRWSAYLSLWTNCYSYATILAPAVITAPMYFRGEIEFGIISQVCPELLQTQHDNRLCFPLGLLQTAMQLRG